MSSLISVSIRPITRDQNLTLLLPREITDGCNLSYHYQQTQSNKSTCSFFIFFYLKSDLFESLSRLQPNHAQDLKLHCWYYVYNGFDSFLHFMILKDVEWTVNVRYTMIKCSQHFAFSYFVQAQIWQIFFQCGHKFSFIHAKEKSFIHIWFCLWNLGFIPPSFTVGMLCSEWCTINSKSNKLSFVSSDENTVSPFFVPYKF